MDFGKFYCQGKLRSRQVAGGQIVRFMCDVCKPLPECMTHS